MDPSQPDGELIRSVRAGDADALGRWYRLEHPRVWKLCLGLLADGHRADDVAQDAMLHLLDRLGSFDARQGWGPWRTAIVLNLCRDQVRRSEARERATMRSGDAGEAGPRALPDPRDAAERSEVREVVVAALAELTPREREAFVLRELEGLSSAETATALGIAEASVRTLLTLARRRLRAVLAPRLGYVE